MQHAVSNCKRGHNYNISVTTINWKQENHLLKPIGCFSPTGLSACTCHFSVHLCTDILDAWWFNCHALPRHSHSRPGFLVSGPLAHSSLHTSGSDESNWKHVLHAGSPDRWDNNHIINDTEKERERERKRGRVGWGGVQGGGSGGGKSTLLKGFLVLNSSTLSCWRFWGSYYRKRAPLCLHMEYPLNLTQCSPGLAPCHSF